MNTEVSYSMRHPVAPSSSTAVGGFSTPLPLVTSGLVAIVLLVPMLLIGLFVAAAIRLLSR